MPMNSAAIQTIYVPFYIIKDKSKFDEVGRFLIGDHSCFLEEIEENTQHPISAEAIASRITTCLQTPIKPHFQQHLQVGESIKDAHDLVNQHSWYKNADGYVLVEVNINKAALQDEKKSETDLLHDADPTSKKVIIIHGENKFLALRHHSMITSENIVAVHIDCAGWKSVPDHFYSSERKIAIDRLKQSSRTIILRSQNETNGNDVEQIEAIKKSLISVKDWLQQSNQKDKTLLADINQLNNILADNSQKPASVLYQIQTSAASTRQFFVEQEQQRQEKASQSNTGTNFFKRSTTPYIEPNPALLNAYDNIVKVRNLTELAHVFDEIKNELMNSNQLALRKKLLS
ncbi:MAG: hypothetical protein ACD_46C00039G0005 [uncultured bacterium]|nr:MAG: hypothetical protein ACD_46C00039G0005 [uncultured bacterium]